MPLFRPYCRLLMVLCLLVPVLCTAQSPAEASATDADSTPTATTTETTGTNNAAADTAEQVAKPAGKPDPFDGRGRPRSLHMNPVQVDGKAFVVEYEIPYEGYVYMYLFDSNNNRVGVAAWVKAVGYHTARLSRKNLKLGEMYTLTLNYKGQMLQAQFKNGEEVPEEPEIVEPENTTDEYDAAGWDPNDFDWESTGGEDGFDYENEQYEDDFNYDEYEDEGYMEVDDSEFDYDW
ncbi:MAG: hypothetical protein ACOCZ8_01310 [Bacteroidota bacterium]